MWQRFTERASKVVFFAQEEAQRSGSAYVRPLHLFLGLFREPYGASTALEMLEHAGYDLKATEAQARALLEPSPPPKDADMTLTPSSKRVIDFAYSTARDFDHNYIGTEHLVIALVHVDDDLAELLGGREVALERLRAACLEKTKGNDGRESSPTDATRHRVFELHADPRERLTSRARAAYVAAGSEADTAALLRALLADFDCRAAMIAARFGVLDAALLGIPEAAPRPAEWALIQAQRLAVKVAQPFLGTEHLLWAILTDVGLR